MNTVFTLVMETFDPCDEWSINSTVLTTYEDAITANTIADKLNEMLPDLNKKYDGYIADFKVENCVRELNIDDVIKQVAYYCGGD